MKKLFIIILFFNSALWSAWWSSYDLSRIAIVAVPVTDMLMKSAGDENVALCYHAIPITNENAYRKCARVHQMLANEILFDVEFLADEIKGSVPNAWLTIDVITGQPNTTLFTLSQSIRTLDEIQKKGIPLEVIPCPRYLPEYKDEETVILTMPWESPQTHTTYSAGTRFVRNSDNDTRKEFGVYVINYEHNTYYSAQIPRSMSYIEKNFDDRVKRALFVLLVTRWSLLKNGVIPYVWGGSSFTTRYKDCEGYFVQEEKTGYWEREEKQRPYSGFDCSELIWRAAQIVGLHFPYKNSGIMTVQLESLKSHESIKEGDILWIPGHVMIVTNTRKGYLVEAAGYRSGYGKVQQVSIKKRFKDVCTYDDIVHKYRNSQRLTILKKNGDIISELPFKILKLIK